MRATPSAHRGRLVPSQGDHEEHAMAPNPNDAKRSSVAKPPHLQDEYLTTRCLTLPDGMGA